MIGQLLDGRYQVIQTLGAGGFGQTYIARDTRIPGNPSCVVKHLKPASSDPQFLEVARRLFHSEAETLAKLGSHDQIPRLLAQFEENQEFFLVQEYIEGHPLSAELQRGDRSPEHAVIQLLCEVLNILVFVHSQGVIHRDIKPDNLIRRASDHKLVLIDFGAIKQVRTQLITSQGQVSATVAIGTPGYMPTEQGQGKPRPNSDIYALGMIGIQAVTGLYPNQLQEDITTGEMIWRHQAQISQGFADVLTKMTRYHFKDRYQSATEALQALQQLTNPYTPPATAPAYTPTQPATNPGYTPPTPPSPPQAPQYYSPTVPLQQPQGSSPRPVVLPTPPPVSTSSNKLPLLIGLGAAAVVGVVSGVVFVTGQTPSNNLSNPQSTSSSSSQSCFALVNGNVRSEPASFRDNVIKNISGEQLTVTGKQTSGDWVEVKLADGRLGWAHRKVISNNPEMDSCLKDKGIPIQLGEDIAPPPPPPTLRPKPEKPLLPEATPEPGLTPELNNRATPEPGLTPGLNNRATPEPGLTPGLNNRATPEPGLTPGLNNRATPEPGLTPGLNNRATPEPAPASTL